MLEAPGRADTVPEHVPPIAGAGATTTPAGKVSDTATPVSVDEPGLTTVKVRVDVPPTATGFGENDLVIVGGGVVWQPPMVTLSRYSSALTPLFNAL